MKKGLLIYQRIILIQFISILIIMALFSIYLYFFNRDKEIKLMSIQTEELKTRLSSSLSIPMWNFDTTSCDKILTQEVKNIYIKCIVINQDDKFWIGKIKNEKGEILDIEDMEKYSNNLKNVFEIKKGKVLYKDNEIDKQLGEVVIYITDDHIKSLLYNLLIQSVLQTIILVSILSIITFIILNLFLDKPLKQITNTASRIANGEVELQADVGGPREIATLAMAFNSMTTELKSKAEKLKINNDTLVEIIIGVKEIIMRLNSSSKEIEAAAQEQTSGANEHASGITEVSATLEELTITAKQITKNVGELVYSSEEAIKTLQENEKQLLKTVSQLEEVGKISTNNAAEIGELGKRSALINEMVELIKEVANKTNILSINASIEASRSGEAGSGFSVVAAEIRELSKETITSAKNVEKAAKEIQDFLNSIIITSESESNKVIESGKTVKQIYDNIETIVSKINNNYSFTQKIDVSIKQQESGSKQAADTMKQMAEIARQSAETARQTSITVKDIVELSIELEKVVKEFKPE